MLTKGSDKRLFGIVEFLLLLIYAMAIPPCLLGENAALGVGGRQENIN